MYHMITFEDFSKIELKVGTIQSAQSVEGSDNLIKLEVDLAEGRLRQIVAGIKKWYKPEQLIGKQVVIVTNLAPRTMMGLESQGMLLAADTSSGPVMVTCASLVAPGTVVR